jgi:predicted PhzF superfamily epimerase YddE/YHI9
MSGAQLSTSRLGPLGPAPELGEFVGCSVLPGPTGGGNPTVVVRLGSWPDDARLAEFARSSGVEETTFARIESGRIELRWFSPTAEVPLCGHGALAAAALFRPWLESAGARAVANLDGKLWLYAHEHEAGVLLAPARITEQPADSLGLPELRPSRVFDTGRDYLAVVDEPQLRRFRVSGSGLEALDKVGFILSAPVAGACAAFRFFAPRAGIPEDSVSISVVPALAAVWGGRSQAWSFRQDARHPTCIRAALHEDKIAVTGEVREFARGTLPLDQGLWR